MPLPLLAAEVGLPIVGKILKGAGKVFKGIGKGVKKIFGGNSKKRQAKKALREGFKAEKKITKFETKIAKQQSKLGDTQEAQKKSQGFLNNLFGGGKTEQDESYQGMPAITPVDEQLDTVQNSVFPTPSKDPGMEFSPYKLESDEGIQALSRGDFDVDFASFKKKINDKKKEIMTKIMIGAAVFLFIVGLIIYFATRRKR